MEVKINHLNSHAQTLETWIAMIGEEIVGHIYMIRENDKRIKFLDAWVHEKYRRQGIFRLLWDTRWEYVKERYSGWTVYAWCKDTSLPLLEEKGFILGEICTYVEREID